MKTFLTYLNKDLSEQTRSFKLICLCAVFALFTITNPLIAKLTPLMMEMMADSLAEAGLTITVQSVTDIDSWTQFFKNIPLVLIVFVIIESNILTKESSNGSLALVLTKGLERYKIILSKTTVITALWTVLYAISAIATPALNALLWEDTLAKNLFPALLLWWLFGLFIINLIIIFSSLSKSNIVVLCGCGGVGLICYIISAIPKINKLSPAYLTRGISLIVDSQKSEDFYYAIMITAALLIISIAASIILFNKKEIN